MHDRLASIPRSLISAQRVTPRYDLMDAAYCRTERRAPCRRLGHVPLIDPNPRRFDLIEFAPAEAILDHERTAAEHTNTRLEDEFGGNTIRVKGDAKGMGHLMFGLQALTADPLVRLRQGSPTIISFQHPSIQRCRIDFALNHDKYTVHLASRPRSHHKGRKIVLNGRTRRRSNLKFQFLQEAPLPLHSTPPPYLMPLLPINVSRI